MDDPKINAETTPESREKKYVRGRNPNSFSKVYSTNVIVDVTDVDVRLNFMNEIIEGKEERIAVCDVQTILHPQAAILLLEQLEDAIKTFGTIEVSESRRNLIRQIKQIQDTD